MRLIDADKINTKDVIGGASEFANDIRKAMQDLIDNAPTVDAEPLRHGKWIAVDDEYMDETLYKCSECHEDFVTIDGMPAQNLYKYCPNCGAKMQEECKKE